MKKSLLKNYAKLIVETGVRVRPGDEVVIRAELDQPEFVALITEYCYKNGADAVYVEWEYSPLQKTHIKYRSKQRLQRVEKWETEKMHHRCETLPAMIYLLSEDPNGQNGTDREKLALSVSARYKAFKKYTDKMDNRYKWCIAAVPGREWAKKVFPDERVSTAVEKLWNAILISSRADGDNPCKAWEEHNRDLKERCDYLNSLSLISLRYHSEAGTDLTVGLIENSRFLGGGEYTLNNEYYNPNIPSEEIFISPKRGEAEGTVFSTRPLSYRGEIIDKFSITFEKGRAVSVHAEKNEELLKKMISMDEGAAYLGECALVPFDCPIRESGILFYNTLFDENAACHLALGEGFSNTLCDYDKLTLEECRKHGINESMIHEDFMIGSDDLEITGIGQNGRETPIFISGKWAF